MRLVEAVVSELSQQVENHIRLSLINTTFDRTINKTDTLLVHFFADFFTHRAAQKISFTERIAGKHLCDLHHLFLINDNALRFLDQIVDFWMNGGDFLLTVLARIIGRDVFHRTRAIKRNKRNNILDPVGTHTKQRLTHTGTFHLEHADRFAARQHFIGEFIIERQARQVYIDALACNELHGCFENRQCFQTQKVELDQPGLLDPFHIELSDRHIGTWIAIHRHEFRKRTIADDDTGGVGRGVAIQPFKLQRHIKKTANNGLLLTLFIDLWLSLDGLCQRYRIGRVLRYKLTETINLTVRHFENTAHVA